MMRLISLTFSILLAISSANNALITTKKTTKSTIKTTKSTIKTTTTTASPLDLQLHAAVWNGNYAAVQSAIQAGANVNSVGTSHGNYDPASPLIDLIYNNRDSISIANLLVSSGSNFNYQNVNGYTALMVACKFNSVNIVNILIQAGVNLDIGDANGQTALMGASIFGYTNIMTVLINAGADVNKVDLNGYSALTLDSYQFLSFIFEILSNFY